MSNKKNNAKRQRTHRTSGGKKAKRKAKRTINRLLMKINRWDRYKEEIAAGKKRGLASRWDTSRMEKHIELLEKHYG